MEGIKKDMMRGPLSRVDLKGGEGQRILKRKEKTG
jgi:hypothetical protein